MNTTTCSERAILVPISTFSSLVILLQEAARSMTVAPERASEYIAKAVDLLRTNGAAGQTSEDRPLFKTEFRALAPWRIRRIVAYVEQNLAAKLEVAQMAHLVGLSICHFSRSQKASAARDTSLARPCPAPVHDHQVAQRRRTQHGGFGVPA